MYSGCIAGNFRYQNIRGSACQFVVNAFVIALKVKVGKVAHSWLKYSCSSENHKYLTHGNYLLQLFHEN